ncbi:Dynein heavy chain 7, axonemal [Harpegnathos saltator]|uniref:Dynein heavy chain 7, axonemal n=1 Tax=Harpegnathos saltator TaxID=610380 RepID=E2C836_HARSA|nr:Dynein heavy chain 7, axonemal [Harpegnathos saltator]
MESYRTEETIARNNKAVDAFRVPKILNTKVEPLFSLPPELMGTKRYKRKGGGELIKRKEKAQRVHGSLYTAERLRKENFRRFMVGLIAKPELPAMGVDLSDDKDVNRYYYYICNGVDTIHTASIGQDYLDAILGLVPGNLRERFPDFTDNLMTEIKEDFTRNIKKAIVEFALADPFESYPPELGVIEGGDQQSVRSDLRGHIRRCREVLRADLHLLNPCMRMTLEHWVRDYSEFRLINMKRIGAHEGSWDLADFNSSIVRQIVDNRQVLSKFWYIGIQEIFLANNRKNLVPSPLRRKQFKKFFDCTARLMESQLLNACKYSLRDFVDYVVHGKPAVCSFRLNILVVSSEIVFEPSFDKLKESLCNILEMICDATRNFERLETQLYLDWAGPQEFLKPKISQPIVERLKTQIRELIDRERIIPEQKMAELKKYAPLYNGEELARVEVFVRDESKNLDEFDEQIKRYHELASRIATDVERTMFVGFFEISHAPFVVTVTGNVEHFKGLLLRHLVDKYQATAMGVVAEYEAIVQRALTPPLNTAALMELTRFARTISDVTMKSLELKLVDTIMHVVFLSDYWLLTDSEISINSRAFQLYHRMPQVFEDNRVIIETKTLEFQEALRVRYQKFAEELDSYQKQVEEMQYWGDIDEIYRYQRKAQLLEERLIMAMDKIDKFNAEEAAFGWEITQYPLRKRIADRLQPFKKLFDSACEFLTKHDKWINSMVGMYRPEDIDNDVGNFYRSRHVKKIAEKEKMIYKLEKGFQEPDVRDLALMVRERIEDFRQYMPVVMTLGNPGMKSRHWEEVSAIVGIPIKFDPDLTLGKVLSMELEAYISQFEGISENATKESAVENAIDKMQREWTDLVFTVNLYKDTDTFVIAGVDDIQLLLDDHIMKAVTIKNSPYIKPFEARIIKWEKTLLLLQDILDQWLKVQGVWMYLEPIFTSPDIQQQMPEEGRKFSTVDKIWRDIMKNVQSDPRVLIVVEIDKMLERLRKSFVLLEQIQLGLNDYLEKKRLYFPRFFFLSNDELLEILSETKDPTRVQPHLKKCFEGIARLRFNEDLEVLSMQSSEGEMVDLTEIISTTAARGQVEKWLVELETEMRKSVRHAVIQAILAYHTKERTTWVLEWPGQTVLCIGQMYWTQQVEEAMSKGIEGLKRYLDQSQQELNNIILLIRGELSKQNRTTLEALVTLDVHSKDVLEALYKDGVVKNTDFQWLCQLRYYWLEDNMRAYMINSYQRYGYEYLGNTTRLVITPLTDRCYRTLFGALSLHLGGAPEGPAGTGKTETTKDLAKAVAKQCVVFNCSEGLDYLALGKFFKGLASCGAWSCFDEFNRIDLEVLSVVAQQILTIQRGINAGIEKMIFEGTEIYLDPTCAIFITMNPGYAGRSELPDNLKALFRPVAMMVPDYALIAENTLYSYGFYNGRPLAVKIVTAYKLCSEQLSSQHHYDYGMRAVKSVLIAAGNLKLRYPNESEDILMLRSIMDVNLPKFLLHDLPLFEGIASDLFPGVVLPTPDYTHINVCTQEACAATNLQCTDFFLEKIQQIYEMMIVRHGFMLVGLPFGGKTSAYRTLAECLSLLESRQLMSEHRVEISVINPKAVTMGQLYGQFDPASHEWSDGILAVSYRAFATSTNLNRKWLVFDGPVDAIWIENMNTVLDDNKKLCLTSGEIIQLAPTTSLIFEPMDLEVASPATVSRCGMIYMEPASLGWTPLLLSWLNTLPATLDENIKGDLKEMYLRFCPPLLHLIRRCGAKEIITMPDANLTRSVMYLYDCFLDDYHDEKYVGALSDFNMRAQVEGCFFFSCIWAMGGTLMANYREWFNVLFRALLADQFPKAVRARFDIPLEISDPKRPYAVPLPLAGSVFDYKFIKEGRGKWTPWLDDLKDVPPIPRDMPVNQIIVSTVETVRYFHLFHYLVTHHKPVLLVGPTGTGKSVYIMEYLLQRTNPEIFKPLFVIFSAQTTANQTQDIIMSKLDRRRKEAHEKTHLVLTYLSSGVSADAGLYGAPPGKHWVIFVDDLSMPQKEEYGAQPPIELLRQWLDHHMWYDRKEIMPLKLVDMQLMCAMGPPASGLDVTPRFKRHFFTLGISEFEDDVLITIFGRIAAWYFVTRDFPDFFGPYVEHMVYATLDVYKETRKNLLPTPAKSHYLFNLRDFSRVIQGVLLSTPEGIPDLSGMKRLWVHEVLRVYGDRLIDETDNKWLVEQLRKTMRERMQGDMDQLFADLLDESSVRLTEVHLRNLIYCDFHDPMADQKVYIEIQDWDALATAVEEYLVEYNSISKTPMDLVLFRRVLIRY